MEKVAVSIKIYSQTAEIWLNKLGYKYKNLCKNIFINRQKQPDIVKNYTNFSKLIKDLKSYIIEFRLHKTIKKIYPNKSILEDPK